MRLKGLWLSNTLFSDDCFSEFLVASRVEFFGV